MNIYGIPGDYEVSDIYRVKVNGENVPVFKNIVSDFVSFSFDKASGPVQVEVEYIDGRIPSYDSARISPVSRNISLMYEEGRYVFKMNDPEILVFNDDAEGHKLMIFCDSAEDDSLGNINPDDENVIYYKRGKVYDAGLIELKSNQTLYIEGGAVVRGRIVMFEAENVTIAGTGILDAQFCEEATWEVGMHTLQTNCSSNIRIEGITIINPPTWVVVLGGSNNIEVQNIKVLGHYTSTDGIDVVGSSDVHIKGCFFQNNDDSIVIKSFNRPEVKDYVWEKDMKNVVAENIIVVGDIAGNAFEIGHEIFCDTVDNIVFKDSDIVSVHGFGTVFSIQHCGSAKITNVLYENINVEHCYDKLLSLRTMFSRYSFVNDYDEGLGVVDGITFRNIHWHTSKFNLGYTVSLIGGYAPENPVKNVVFDGFYVDDKRAEKLEDLNIFTRYCENIKFI